MADINVWGHSLGTALKLLTVFPSLWLCGSLLYFSYTLNMLMETMSRFALSCAKTRCSSGDGTSPPWRTTSPRSSITTLHQLDCRITNKCRMWKKRFAMAGDLRNVSHAKGTLGERERIKETVPFCSLAGWFPPRLNGQYPSNPVSDPHSTVHGLQLFLQWEETRGGHMHEALLLDDRWWRLGAHSQRETCSAFSSG